MKLIEILAFVIPAFGAGIYFSSMLRSSKIGNKITTEEISGFIINTVIVISNIIIFS